MVVVFHVLGTSYSAQIADPSFHVGEAGVDIFFVISGVVMFVSTHERSVSPGQFLWARFLRIGPLYYIATMAFLAIAAALSAIPPDFSWSEIVLSFLFIPFENTITRQPVPILGVGWTLNYEVIFYLILAAGLTLRTQVQRIALMAAIFVILVAARIVLDPKEAFAMRLTSPLYFEFLAGYVLAYGYSFWRRTVPLAGVALMTIGFVALFTVSAAHPGMPRTIIYGIPGIAIVAGAILAEPLFNSAWSKALRFAGDASYSIYLVHGIVIYAVVGWVPADPALNLPIAALLLTGSIGAGVLCYLLVEKQLIRLLKPARKPRAPVEPQPSVAAPTS